MHLEEVIGDKIRGRDGVNLEMNSEMVARRVRRCTWRPSLCELGGRHQERLEIHFELRDSEILDEYSEPAD